MTLIDDAPAELATTLPAHPLEPLTAEELTRASAILTAARSLAPTARFVFVELQEPPKQEVLAWTPGTAWDRQAFVVLRERAEQATYEAVVSLSRGELVSWTRVDGVQPPMMAEEFLACEAAVQADPRWQAAMRLRGVTDFSLTMVDPWASGYLGPQDDAGTRRLARPLTFVRSSPDDNGYARPVEGLVVEFDLDTATVLDVIDTGVVPLPSQPGNYYPELMVEPGNVPAFTEQRPAPAQIDITQPDGASFTVDGHAVSWQNWRLRLGFTPREGLVLHDVRYVDRGTERPVLYRAALSEMYVPYGDPAPLHKNKNVFDEGEYGMGIMANALELGCDCLGEIHYFDAVVNDNDGAPVTMPNAVCMHEEDDSIGWKHTDFRTGRAEVRRGRKLVISFIATVGNYEYGFYWNLGLDGSIEFEVKLTGIISTGALLPGETPTYGTVVAPGLYGPNHQHFFNVRMDMRVDGDRNNLYEVQTESVPAGPDNPHGNAWVQTKRLLATEQEAQRRIDPFAARQWLITSADTRNALGGEPGYKLEPGSNVVPFWQPGSQQADRGGFAENHLWATPYADRERYAAGEYIAQNPGFDGLVKYTAADRPVAASDLVVWYTAGAHHVIRPEDWPVMPVSKVGFHLKPVGFFDGNPMLDLPAPELGLPQRRRGLRVRRGLRLRQRGRLEPGHPRDALDAADGHGVTADLQAPAQRAHVGSLAAGTMSGPEVMAQSVAGIAPSAVMATGPALVAGSAGGGVLYAYLAATVVLLLVGYCVTQFAQRHNSAGSLYEWIGMAFGRGTGFVGGTGLVIGYVGIAIASLAGTVLFLGSLLGSAGVDVTSTGAQVLLYVVLGSLAAVAMVRGIQLSTRVGLVLEVLSIGAILAVIAVVLVQSGVTSAPLHPAGGITVEGVALGMVLAILGFVGFESAASLGVEARDPVRMVPRAVLGSAALAGGLYLLSAYTQLVGFDGDTEALSTSASALNELAASAGVSALGHVVDAGATLSFFACVTGSLNAAGRTVFAMGRHDLLGGKLGSVHEKHRTPHIALYALTGLAAAVPVVLTLSGLTALEILGYLGTIGTFGYMLAYLLMSLATPVFLRKVAASWHVAAVVGGLAALGMLYVFYRSVWPVPASPYNVLPYVFLALLVPALVRYAVVRGRGGPGVVDLTDADAAVTERAR